MSERNIKRLQNDLMKEMHRNQIFKIITEREYDLIALLHVDSSLVEAIAMNSALPAPYWNLYDEEGAMCTLNHMREYGAANWVAAEDKEKYLIGTSLETICRELADRGSYDIVIRSNIPAVGGGFCCRRLQHYYLDEKHDTILIIDSDITDHVRLQQELELQLAEEKRLRKEAMAANLAKTEFLSRMSHDIRTPLNGIIGMTYLASLQENPTDTTECLKKIDISSKFLLGLINDILDMAKAESGKIELHPEPYLMADFDTYLDSVIRPLYEEKNQIFTAETHPVKTAIPIIDILRFNQIMFNLLSNAVKYTPEGGHISLTVYNELVAGHKERITAIISDDGIGMSEAFQKVLFDSFTQEDRSDILPNRGSGLGLAIAKQMVDLMGGTIVVKSELGKGTTFTVVIDFDYLEADQAVWDKEAEKAECDLGLLTYKHVLLCEDHPLNQELMLTLLENQGMIVELAENGQQGVEMFRNSTLGFYDIILMDIRMPVMDGYEATRQIRRLKRTDAMTVPILALTADAFAEDVKVCREAGMDGHIAKPVDPQKMYEQLIEVILR